MPRPTTAHRFVAILILAFPFVVAACSASKPVTGGAASPAQPAPANVGRTNQQPPAVPTRGTVTISEEIRRACGIADQDAYFAFDSATILSSDVTPLDQVARCLTTGPLKGRSLRLVGHADPRGSEEYNMALGQGRADSVEDYLDRHGLLRSRMASTTRGAMDATGTSESGWAHDRRVDVMLGT